MNKPDDEQIEAFARKHDLTCDQARQLLEQHGHDDEGLAEAARNLVHFLRAPS